jgi:hypoxanthine phosphoribosyltransferase
MIESSPFQALHDLITLAGSSMTLKKSLNAIARRTARALNASGCAILLLDPPREYLVPAGFYGLSELYLRKGSLRARESMPAVMDGEVVAIQDVMDHPGVAYPDAARKEGISSILGAPMSGKEGVMGALRVYYHQPHEFTPEDIEFIRAASGVCTLFLENIGLHHVLSRVQRKSKSEAQETGIRFAPGGLRPAEFSHPSESDFANLLDFYRIEWLYEPRSFPIEWKDNEIAEMFTPDFYLPETDLYIELTTMKQRLATDKNRKVRRLRELYPEIKIRLINRNDYGRLLAKYGHGPLGEPRVQGVDRVLFSHHQIQRRVKALARQISRDYAGKQLVLVGVLKGMTCFLSDLMLNISLPLSVDFMAVSNFGGNARPPVIITKDLDENISGKHVIMVEDIVDTGMTLNYIMEHLGERQPASLKVCALLDKRVRRLVNIPLDYVGFEVPDEFVVGYGLDFQGQYRNLRFIGVVNASWEGSEAEKEKAPSNPAGLPNPIPASTSLT